MTSLLLGLCRRVRRPVVLAMICSPGDAQSLPRAVRSADGLRDGLVAAVDAPDDAAGAAIRSLGGTATAFDWCDDFAAARNAALACVPSVVGHCGGRGRKWLPVWVLSIDADEWLTGSARDFLAGFRAGGRKYPLNAYYSPCRDDADGQIVCNPRLFPRKGAYWKFRAHENVEYRGADPKLLVCPELLLGHEERPVTGAKMARTFAMAEKDMIDHPDDPAPKCHVGVLRLVTDIKDTEGYRLVGEAAMGSVGGSGVGQRAFMWCLNAAAAQFGRCSPEVFEWFDKAYARSYDSPWLRLFHAQAMLDAGRNAEVLARLEGIESMRWDRFGRPGNLMQAARGLRAAAQENL